MSDTKWPSLTPRLSFQKIDYPILFPNNLVVGLAFIFTGLVYIFTLGRWHTNASYVASLWNAKKRNRLTKEKG